MTVRGPLTRRAANVDNTIETVVGTADGLLCAAKNMSSKSRPLAATTYQLPPLPTPTAVMGEQLTPTTRPFTVLRIPSSPRMSSAEPPLPAV
jgi:hypothetical protein